MSVGGVRSAPLPRRPRRSTRWSPLRARVAHGTRVDANRRLAIRATGVGAAALAAGWYLGPEDGLIPVLVLAALGGYLGIRRAREVWKRRTVGRWIRGAVDETPVSLGMWRVAGSGYWLRPAADGSEAPPPAPPALAVAAPAMAAGPAPWATSSPPAGAPAAPPQYVSQPVAPLAVATTTFAAPATWVPPVAQPSPAAPTAPTASTTPLPAVPPTIPPATADRPIFAWEPPRETVPYAAGPAWGPVPPTAWPGAMPPGASGPAWGAPSAWPPPAPSSGVRHGPLWGPGVAMVPSAPSPVAPGPGARWLPHAEPGGAPSAAAGAWDTVPGATPAAGAVAGWPTMRAGGPAWPYGGWAPSPWIATSAGLGWRPPSSGVGPFQPGDEVELLATSTWIWVAGVRVERYARAATLDVIGQDGLAITDGDSALRRWVTLVPDQDDAVPWAVSQLAAMPADPGRSVTADATFVQASSAPPMAAPEPPLSAPPRSDIPARATNGEPSGPGEPPAMGPEPAPDEDLHTEPPRRAGPRWDDPRSVIDDGRR